MGFKDWFKAQPEQKNYMDGWEDGYDDGWEGARNEIIEYLREAGYGAAVIDVEGQF